MRTPLRPGDPRQLGGYHLLSRLGQGGMGTVYLGRAADDRLVAIKVVRPEYADEDEFRGRFRSEVNRARQVPPFCTAAVLDADPDHATPYLVVEFVDGPSLAEVVDEQGPLTAGSLHSVAVGVATALAAIHGAGVIHRDLKPRNVLFALGTPKVIDFGIARALEVTSQHTRTDQMVGTVAYMAPERFDSDSRALTPAADVFAWGAVVSYAAAARTPFHADSAAATAARILTQPPVLDGLHGQLRELVEASLEKEPGNRPTAHELLDLLLAAGPHDPTADLSRRPELKQAAEAAQHTSRNRTTVATRRRKPRSRRPVLLSIAAVLAGVLLAGLAVGMYGSTSGTGTEQPVAQDAPVRTVPGPSIIDALTRPGQWRATDDDGGKCTFDDDTLVAETRDSATYSCKGPADTFAGDQSIAVDVELKQDGSCAEIWLRYVARSGYRVSACSDEIRIALDSTDLRVLASQPVEAFAIGTRHRLAVTVHSGQAVVTVDGAEMIRAAVTDPTLAAGQVIFGVSGADDGGTGEVAYADAQLRSL